MVTLRCYITFCNIITIRDEGGAKKKKKKKLNMQKVKLHL